MQNPYPQLNKFQQRINSEIDKMRNISRKKRDTKGLLARQSPALPATSPGEQDYTKRIANYVNSIREQRLALLKSKKEEVIDV
jgi:hypothetical protein